MKMSREDKVIAVANYTFLTLFCLTCLLPFIYVLMVSFTSENSYGKYGARLIPKEFSLDAYKMIFSRGKVIIDAYLVTIFITVAGTVLALIVCALFAYPLSRKNLPGKKIFLGYILFSMLISGGIIPTYITVSNWLGLQDSFFALILPGIFSAWNMLLFRNFFADIPKAIEESAEIDGANDVRIFISIVLPLSKAIFATLGLFWAVGYWNAWFPALLYIETPSKYPIMLLLQNMLNASVSSGGSLGGGQNTVYVTEMLKMATVVVVVLPILCVYPFLQKYFAKGVMVGSVKG